MEELERKMENLEEENVKLKDELELRVEILQRNISSINRTGCPAKH